MFKRPLLSASFAFCLGIASSLLLRPTALASVLATILVTGLASSMVLFKWAPLRGSLGSSTCLTPLLLAVFTVFGAVHGHPLPDAGQTELPPWYGWVGTAKTLVVSGIVDEGFKLRPDGTVRFPLKVESVGPFDQSSAPYLATHLLWKILVSAPFHQAKELLPGDRIVLKTGLRHTQRFINPYGSNIAATLKRRHIVALGGVRDNSSLYLLTPMATNRPLGRVIAKLRTRLMGVILYESTSTAAREILGAILLGDGTGIGQTTRQAFNATGTAHLLAVSGLHLGIISLFLFLIANRTAGRIAWIIRRLPRPQLSAMITLPSIWLYTLLTGSNTPTVRAAIMASAYLWALLLRKNPDGLGALCAASLIILIQSPSAMFSISFQLSFVVVLSLLVLMPSLPERPKQAKNTKDGKANAIQHLANKWLCRLSKTTLAFLCASTIASLASFPLTAYHFGQVAPFAIACNLIVVPIVSLLLIPLTVGVFLSMPWTPLAAVLVRLSSSLVEFISFLTSTLAKLSGGTRALQAPSPLAISLWFLGLLLLFKGGPLFPRGSKKRYLSGILALLLATICTGPPTTPKALRQGLEVTFFDVCQGDATLLRLDGGEVVLVDGGGLGYGPDPGESVVVPHLRHLGIDKIDVVILSHGHPDHVEGLLAVLGHLEIGEIWHPGGPPASFAHETFLMTADLLDIPLKTPQRPGDIVLQTQEVTIQALHPAPYEPGAGVNDNSLVLMVSHGMNRILLPGDLEAPGEGIVLEEADEGFFELDAEVLKVPHHGGNTSTSEGFLQAVRPLYAMVSVGRGNRYGHPSPQALARLEGRGVKVWRTDLHGAITLKSDGYRLTIDTVNTSDGLGNLLGRKEEAIP